MQRLTITLDDELTDAVDALCAERGYSSRSEAIRDLIRAGLVSPDSKEPAGAEADQPSFGALSYVYDHHTRDLAKRLTDNHHHHHDLSVATTHVHINPEECLEVAILRGSAQQLRQFADGVVSQRGVRYGRLHIIPAAPVRDDHGHAHPHPHQHHHD